MFSFILFTLAFSLKCKEYDVYTRPSSNPSACPKGYVLFKNGCYSGKEKGFTQDRVCSKEYVTINSKCYSPCKKDYVYSGASDCKKCLA